MTWQMSLEWIGGATVACGLMAIGDIAILKHSSEDAIHRAVIGVCACSTLVVIPWIGVAISFVIHGFR